MVPGAWIYYILVYYYVNKFNNQALLVTFIKKNLKKEKILFVTFSW
jgi:hypothetical protein